MVGFAEFDKVRVVVIIILHQHTLVLQPYNGDLIPEVFRKRGESETK